MKIYLDMDGVLSDLDGALCLFGEVSRETLRDEALRQTLIRERAKSLGLLHWESLAPLNRASWEKDLRVLHAYGNDIEILSSYGTWDPLEVSPMSHQGKCNWLRTYYGGLFTEGIISGFNGVEKCGSKKLFSLPGTLLIDDSPDNVAAFKSRGGEAFLYRADAHSTILTQVLASCS